MSNRSKCWDLSAKGWNSKKGWNLRTKLEIDQVFKFQCIHVMSNQSKCLNLSAKYQIDQNAAICVKKFESAKMLKFKDKIGTRSKCWNFNATYQIEQNVAIWVIKHEMVKKVGGQNSELIKVNVKSIKMLKYECKISNQSKCWNLSAKYKFRSKCCNLREKVWIG